MTEQSFAIGCFHFGLRKPPPPNFEIRDYIAEVEKAIGSVPNVDGIAVDCAPEVLEETLTLSGDDNMPDLSTSGPYPYLSLGHVSFDLLIPVSKQDQLSPGSVFTGTNTERFEVETHYQYHLPVTIVRPIDPSAEPVPSEAVIIVRELLRRELKRQPQSLIDLQVLGPSPLHADFHLHSAPEIRLPDEWTFDLEIDHTRGYDRYDFFYNKNVFSDAGKAMYHLTFDLMQELDLYYLLKQREAQKIYAWDCISKLTDDLIELHRRHGIKAFFERTFKGSRLVNDTFVSLAEFEGDEILRANSTQETYRNTYDADTVPYIQEMIDKTIAERATYPTQQTRSLLQLFETRRLSASELRVVLISAVSGGVFGALVTALLGNGQ